MAKSFSGLQSVGRTEILAILEKSAAPLTVSQIAKQLNGEEFKDLSKKDRRQFTQNVVDRLHRHQEVDSAVGAKKTGREVTVYLARVAAPAPVAAAPEVVATEQNS